MVTQFGSPPPTQVVPTLSSNTIQQAVGMVGAVIMPHNIYLHSALVQVRHRPRCLDLKASPTEAT